MTGYDWLISTDLRNSCLLESTPEGGLRRFLFLKPVELPKSDEFWKPDELFIYDLNCYKSNFESRPTQQFVNEFFILYISIFRLTLLEHFFDFLLAHSYTICSEVEPQFSQGNRTCFFKVKDSKTLK